MSNWCSHDIVFICGNHDFARVHTICRENIPLWSEKYCTCEQVPGGIAHVQYETRSTPRYDLAFEISAAVPGSVVLLKYDEPMMITFGDLLLRDGHLLHLSERRDNQMWEWSADIGKLREYELTYADPEDPYGDHTARLVRELPCVEEDLFRPVNVASSFEDLSDSPTLGGESE